MGHREAQVRGRVRVRVRVRVRDGVECLGLLEGVAGQATLAIVEVGVDLSLLALDRALRVLDQLDAEGEAIDDDPRDPAGEEAVADVVGERHADEEEEGGDGLTRVLPVDLGHTLG